MQTIMWNSVGAALIQAEMLFVALRKSYKLQSQATKSLLSGTHGATGCTG
jgi:hypothetical protein